MKLTLAFLITCLSFSTFAFTSLSQGDLFLFVMFWLMGMTCGLLGLANP